MICNSQRYILLTILRKKWFLFHLFNVYFSIFQDSKDDFFRLRPLFKKVREKSLNWRDFYPKTVQISFTWTFHILREAVASHADVLRSWVSSRVPTPRTRGMGDAWEATVYCRSRVVPIFRERVKSPLTRKVTSATRFSSRVAPFARARIFCLFAFLKKR